MFKRKWPKRAISDEGFEVAIGGRGKIIYIEQERCINFATEVLFVSGNYIISIWSELNYKWNYYNGEIKDTTIEERLLIINRVKSALNFLCIKFEMY